MATVFHDFYEYRGPKDMHKLLQFLETIRESAHSELKEYFEASVRKESLAFRLELIRMINEAIKRGEKELFNVKSDVYIFFHEDSIYLLFSGVPEKFLRHAYLKDRSYDGRSERPSNISEEDWHDRFETILKVIHTTVEKSALHLVLTDLDDVLHTIIRGASEIS